MGGGDLHTSLRKSQTLPQKPHIPQNLAKILLILILPNLNATELNTIANCNNNNQECKIDTTYKDQSIQNHNPLSLKKITIETQLLDFINYNTLTLQEYITINSSGNSIKNFINYGTLTTTSKYSLDTTNTGSGGFENIINYGHISGYFYMAGGETSTTHITNYGAMSGVQKTSSGNKTIYVNNFGTINLCEKNNGNGCDKRSHFKNISSLILQNYAMKINVDSAIFNGFSGSASDNSHLVLDSVTNVSFADKNSRLILDFGDNFEFGAGYLFNKLVVNTDGTSQLSVDLSRLTTKSDIFYITQQGDKFIVHLAPQYGAVGSLYKSNIRTMNNFYTISNAMIYPRKYSKTQNLRKSSLRDLPTANRGNPLALSSLRMSGANVAIQDLNTNETFFYQNESQNLQTRRIQRQTKRNYSRNVKDSSLRADSQNLRGNPQNQRNLQNLAQNPSDYYFILTPFVNHNLFFESGRYNLSGFDYGFLTAFSGKIAEANSLGAHFAFSYGNLNDSHDKDLSIKSMNFMLGLNYKLDLIYDMFLKARGDVFYFLNALDSATLKNIKPNNLGFGVSVSYGKDFDFKQGGVLGIEGGIDYKALNASEITLDSMNETYQKSLYNVLYVDLGISYAKYFGNFGFNANLGIKGNITANKLAKSQIRLNAFNRSVDMVLDNDKILGYANVALSYVLNHKNFDMEFSLAYYGNFGDRVISNGGGFEWRVTW